MSASYYSTAELDRATHHEELVQGNDIEVNYTTGISLNLYLIKLQSIHVLDWSDACC
jgi:hypothetical protein